MSYFLTTFCFSAGVEGIQSYQRNVHLLPNHKQKLAADISRYRNADNLWDELRDEFTLPHYEENPEVQKKVRWFMHNQKFLIRSANRAAPYLYYIHQQVKKRHLPAELVLLPIIESGYNPFSISSVGAAGIWQLMPATANDLGIRQDRFYDGRRDFIASTRGALNHLSYLQNFFDGNWLLALAAYDTGEGNVRKSIRKNIMRGHDTSFWSLPLAAEAKNYVPSLLALAVIISDPDRYPVKFPKIKNAPYLAQVEVGKQISLKKAASLAGITHARLLALNSGFKKSTVSNIRGSHRLVLPIENVEKFTKNLALIKGTKGMDWVHYQAKTGDTIKSVAKKFKTPESKIRQANHISKNRLPKGYNLIIPKQTTSDITTTAKTIQSNQTKYSLQPGDTVYMVRNKDDLDSIAKRFKTSKEAIITANKLPHSHVIPGKQIIIPTHSNQQLA